MIIEWKLDSKDINRVRSLMQRQGKNQFVERRRKTNCTFPKPELTRNRIWRAMVCMRLTTMQRSGPDSPVAKFSALSPFPLDYDFMGGVEPRKFIAQNLANNDLKRFSKKIPEELAYNFDFLEAGAWNEMLARCNGLRSPDTTRKDEQAAAEYLQRLKGFGPKQSRNVLQALGLTRYEIPIDSRFYSWLNNVDFPIKVAPTPLQDEAYYRFISDGIWLLASQADTLPCLFDAAVFSLGDTGDWNEAAMTY